MNVSFARCGVLSLASLPWVVSWVILLDSGLARLPFGLLDCLVVLSWVDQLKSAGAVREFSDYLISILFWGLEGWVVVTDPFPA
jgi:hypothetical protein